MGFLLGAAHGVEIAFVFRNFNQFIVPKYASLVFTDGNLAGREALADSMSSYWAEFAYNGLPGTGRDGLEVEWTAWDNSPGADKCIILDTQEDGGIRMISSTVTLDALKYRLLSDTTFSTQEQYCKMYADLFYGTDLWDDDEYANLGEYGCGDYPVE